MSSQYEFEMTDTRKALLSTIAEKVRKEDLSLAKHKAVTILRRRGVSRKNIEAFKTAFDKALEMVGNHDDETPRIEIEDMPPILENSDGAIRPSEINGTEEIVIRSVKREDKYSQRETVSVYPVYRTPERYYVCSCPSQKYHTDTVCKHTIFRVIERNIPKLQ